MARQILPLVLIVAAFIGGAFYFLHYASADKATAENFRKLSPGMTYPQVEKIFGTRTSWFEHPGDAKDAGLLERWTQAKAAGAVRMDCWDSSGGIRFLAGFDANGRLAWKGSKP